MGNRANNFEELADLLTVQAEAFEGEYEQLRDLERERREAEADVEPTEESDHSSGGAEVLDLSDLFSDL
jgi:prefoldin subunit 5